MPIGKDSITKRVAKQTPANDIVTETLTPPQTEDKNIAPELVATVGVAPAKTTQKTPAKKTTTTSKTTASKATTAKSTAEKKPAAPKKTASKPAEAKTVETAVLANVAPETVEKVIGHKEDEKYEKVQIGQKMPDFLL
ncbi:MAG: hypothetical protein IKJ07_03210 [Clostridia bacterium]|nr:hypothetical protein [Clostridia bacterium]